MPAEIILIAKIVLGFAFGTALLFASRQDFETRMLTLPMAWVFVLITGASFLVNGHFIVLGLYALFMLISFFLYEKREIQIVCGMSYFVLALFQQENLGMEQAGVLAMVGLFWAIAFLSSTRGESDYNVIFTVIAYLGVAGFQLTAVVIIAIFASLTLYEIVLHSRNQHITVILYQIYFRLTGISKEQPIEVVYKGKQERLPVIPMLHISIIISFFVTGIVLKEWHLLVVGGYSLLAVVVGLIYSRTKIGLLPSTKKAETQEG